VPPGQPTNPTAPDWEYLIAHHFPNRYSRTLEIRPRGRAYHFCARCSGELLGFVAFFAVFLLLPEFAALRASPIVALILGICPVVAFVDWLTQTLRARESTNALRVASGALLGAAFGGLVAYGLTAHWLLFGLGLTVAGFYLATAMVVLYRTGAWNRVIAEHFP
jgi:uncharacterized membrane protein